MGSNYVAHAMHTDTLVGFGRTLSEALSEAAKIVAAHESAGRWEFYVTSSLPQADDPEYTVTVFSTTAN